MAKPRPPIAVCEPDNGTWPSARQLAVLGHSIRYLHTPAHKPLRGADFANLLLNCPNASAIHISIDQISGFIDNAELAGVGFPSMRNIYLTTYGAQYVSEQQCIVLLQFFPNIKHCEAMPVTSRKLGPPGRLDQLGALALDYLFVSWANCPVLLWPILSQRWTARKVYILLTWHVSDILATANWDAISKINIVDLNITIDRRVEAEVAGIVSLIRACRTLRRLYLGSPHKLMYPLLEGILADPCLRLRELFLAYKLNERLRSSHIKKTVALLLSGPENLSALRELKIMVPRDTHDDIEFTTESFRSYFLNRRVRYTLLWTW